MKKNLAAVAVLSSCMLCGGENPLASGKTADVPPPIVQAACPLIPMGAITGKPDKAALTRTLENWASVGVTQFMIYARSGCELEYLSPEYMEMCRWICAEAKRLNFSAIWLYDEFNWPSGTCKGRVLQKDPSFGAKIWRVSRKENGELDFKVVVSRRMSDLFDPAAVDCFMQLTHAVYEQHLKEYFGTLIKGFFMDEPNIFFPDAPAPAGTLLELPWYPGLEADYRQLTGGELRGDIARSLAIGNNFFEGACNQLFAKRFRENCIARIAAWCKARNMVLTGHLMDESTTGRGLQRNGHPMEVLSAFSLPGMDDIFTPLNAEQVEYLTLGTLRYAAEKNKNGALAELFALGPGDMEFDRMIRQFWICAAFGVDRYVMAISPLTAQGNALKRNYFLPFTDTQAWFPFFRELGAEAARAAQFAGKKRRSHIAVRYSYSPQLLADLLNSLSNAQYQWELIMPGEKSDLPVVFSVKNNGIYEEKSNSFFGDFATLDFFFLRESPRRVTVWEKGGDLAGKLLLREYEDGTVLIINLTDNERNLHLISNGRKEDIFISRRGVWISNENNPSAYNCGGKVPLAGGQGELSWEMPHTMRGDFIGGKSEFSAGSEIRNVRVAVRKHPFPAEVKLDGRELKFTAGVPELPPGFRELYKVSEALVLPAGKHVLELADGATDYPYLPAVFLLGEFTASPDKVLKERSAASEFPLYGYVGKVTQKSMVDFPADARYIYVPGSVFAGELFINGKSCGRRITSLPGWEIPAELRGKRGEISVSWYLSCGQLFGETFFRSPASGPLLRKFGPDNRKTAKLPELYWGKKELRK